MSRDSRIRVLRVQHVKQLVLDLLHGRVGQAADGVVLVAHVVQHGAQLRPERGVPDGQPAPAVPALPPRPVKVLLVNSELQPIVPAGWWRSSAVIDTRMSH